MRFEVRDRENRIVRSYPSLAAAIVRARLWGAYAMIWDNLEKVWVRW
jgi:hypothetical protein